MTEKSPRRRVAPLIAVAALAGIAAGAVAVYVMEGRQGNGADTVAGDCLGALPVAAAVDDHIGGEMAGFRAATVPNDLGGIAFKDADGNDLTLAGMGDKLLLVNLWATWCVPCRTEMPALDSLEADLGGEDFQVVPINLDNVERGKAFYDEIGLEHLGFFADESNAVFSEVKKRGLALGLPTTILVDGDGCEVGVLQGPAEWHSDDAKALIEAAIGA